VQYLYSTCNTILGKIYCCHNFKKINY
jgi:hypothetical protein